MIILYIILILAGTFPLFAFLYKRKEHFDILKNGVKTKARVSQIKTNVRRRGYGANYDNVVYTYLPEFSNQYYAGELMAKIDEYKLGDELDLYFLPEKPHKKALTKVKYNLPAFLFVLAFFAGTLYACYKIYQMVGD